LEFVPEEEAKSELLEVFCYYEPHACSERKLKYNKALTKALFERERKNMLQLLLWSSLRW
jgi:hypothetical protein